MRNFLLSILWMSIIGNAIQFLIMATATWQIISGSYSFSDLTLEVYVTQLAPWLSWIKTVLAAMLGDLGSAILTLPIFVISPMKFVAGLVIGWWANTELKNLSTEPALQ